MFLLFYFRFNSAKKDNDFIYHEAVPSLETLPSVKGILSYSDISSAYDRNIRGLCNSITIK